MIIISTTKGVWSEGKHKYRKIEWLSSSVEFEWRNMRLITELELFGLSTYYMGNWIIGNERLRLEELAISIKVLV